MAAHYQLPPSIMRWAVECWWCAGQAAAGAAGRFRREGRSGGQRWGGECLNRRINRSPPPPPLALQESDKDKESIKEQAKDLYSDAKGAVQNAADTVKDKVEGAAGEPTDLWTLWGQRAREGRSSACAWPAVCWV